MDKFEKLIGKGLEALESRDYPGAARAGQDLIELRHSYGFELLARCHSDQGQTDEALRVLDEGLLRVPGHWRLLELKAIALSDGERCEQALPFYRAALEADNTRIESVRYNLGLTLQRMGRTEEAIEQFRQAEEVSEACSDLWVLIRTSLIGASAPAEALALAERAVAEMEASGAVEGLGRVKQSLGGALVAAGQREKALELAHEMLSLWDEEAFWILRQADDRRSGTASSYRAMFEGVFFDGRPFYRTYQLVAESPDDLLEQARSVENRELRDSLRLVEVLEVDQAGPGLPLGVYWRSPYFTSSQ
ncbi:tetratricopeptide repeat protein [bacterium CPR1]|nr:tetratricopeptide repeat protein [bacterium CPR1]